MTETTTLTRKQLVSIARKSIDDTKADGFEVPVAITRRLMKVARTTETITGDWRHKTADCGCLVGTYYGHEFDEAQVTEVEEWIGYKFSDHLADIIGYGSIESEVILIVDEAK